MVTIKGLNIRDILQSYIRDKTRILGVISIIVLAVAAVVSWYTIVPLFTGKPEADITIYVTPTPIGIIDGAIAEAAAEPVLSIDIPIQDNVVTAVVSLTSCEYLEGCMVPLWKTYERKVSTGLVPNNIEVDVIGCYYPVVRSDPEGEQLPDVVLEVNSEYRLEGLFCEVVYKVDGEDTVKGLIQYWFLRFDATIAPPLAIVDDTEVTEDEGVETTE